MFITIKRGARLAAVAGLSAAVIVGLAGPAAAAPPAGSNQALALEFVGIVDAVIGEAVTGPPDFLPDSFNMINAAAGQPTFLTADLIEGATTTSSANARVAGLTVDLQNLLGLDVATLTADNVTSQCSTDGTAVTGSATLTNASIAILGIGGVPIDLAVNPDANTMVDVPGVGTVTLNRQVTNADGSLTVDAIFISILPNTAAEQTITIATSSCQVAILAVPVIAPQFAAGAAVLGMMGLGVFLYRRRENASGIAQA